MARLALGVAACLGAARAALPKREERAIAPDPALSGLFWQRGSLGELALEDRIDAVFKCSAPIRGVLWRAGRAATDLLSLLPGRALQRPEHMWVVARTSGGGYLLFTVGDTATSVSLGASLDELNRTQTLPSRRFGLNVEFEAPRVEPLAPAALNAAAPTVSDALSLASGFYRSFGDYRSRTNNCQHFADSLAAALARPPS
jgi:hypothetical protein